MIRIKWDMRRLSVMTGLPPSVLLKIYDLIFKFRNKSSILDLLFLTVPPQRQNRFACSDAVPSWNAPFMRIEKKQLGPINSKESENSHQSHFLEN